VDTPTLHQEPSIFHRNFRDTSFERRERERDYISSTERQSKYHIPRINYNSSRNNSCYLSDYMSDEDQFRQDNIINQRIHDIDRLACSERVMAPNNTHTKFNSLGALRHENNIPNIPRIINPYKNRTANNSSMVEEQHRYDSDREGKMSQQLPPRQKIPKPCVHKKEDDLVKYIF
jgi:hypothetical protein